MFNRKFLLLCLGVLVAGYGYAQRGKDGAKTVSTPNQVFNEYTALTADAAAGATSIQVVASGLNANNRFGYPLSPGDLLFLIQVQGTSIDWGSWWWNFGYIISYNNCGLHEFAEVLSVPDPTTINLACELINNYTDSGRVVVVRVPRITSLLVNNGGSVTCDAWNGSEGGIIALEVMGNTILNAGGSIDASGKGFRGGVNADMNSGTGVSIYASTNQWDGAEKGEGVAGSVADYDFFGGRYGKNAAANGGGGGNAHNGGGGGGSNASGYGIYNGCGNPDTSNAAWIAAWDLESANFHQNQSDGGGRGGYTYSYQNMDATLVGPGDLSWGGDYRRNEGGQGGRALNYYTGNVYMGGGGGAGDQGPDTDFGGDGGAGGGLIYFLGYGDLSGSGSIVSNGNPGQDAQGTPPWNGHAGIDGGGGGGGGGAMVVKAVNIASTLNFTANGGDGGDQIKTKSLLASANGEAEGPGGGGGGGFITHSAGTPVKTANGGANGISYAQSAADNGVLEFPPNGATRGGRGSIANSIVHFFLTAAGDSICPGDTAMLTAHFVGNPPAGTILGWYDAEVGGNLLGTGDTLFLAGITDTAFVYAGFCPGTYRVPVSVIVFPATADGGPDVFLCNGSSDTLHASGGISYLWSPGSLLSDSTVAEPTVNVAASTGFVVTIQNAYGCFGIDTVMVFVDAVNAVISSDTAVCDGNPVVLEISGGGSYLWSTGDTTEFISFVPSNTQVYSVTVSVGLCADTADVLVTVHPLPMVNLGADTTFCQGGSLWLDAGNPGSFYLWQDNSVNQTINATATGIWSVTVTDSNTCSASDSMSLTVIDLADATIFPVTPFCDNLPAFDLAGADPGGLWTGPGITDASAGTFDPSVSGAGTFTVSYLIGGMCGDSDTAEVRVFETPGLSFDVQTESCTGAGDASIGLNVTGGLEPYSYLWSNGADSGNISMLLPDTYSVTVEDSNGCVVSAGQLLLPSETPCYSQHIYFPNIFSPNGDGFNDIFFIRGAGVSSMELIIYDRWGERVFESESLADGWDGTFRGSNCGSGVYFFNLKVVYENEESFSGKGNVTLVR